MERDQQLRNVAFGGAWSEQIAGREAVQAALAMIEGAAARTADEDLRNDPIMAEALALAVKSHPKGKDLAASWTRALGRPRPDERAAELERIARLLRLAVRE